MPPDTIQPIQDILNRWILIGQALVGSIGALAFVVAFLWTKIGRFKARTNAPSIDAGQDDQVGRQTPETKPARDFAQLPRAEEPPHVTRVGSGQVRREVRISRRAVLSDLLPGQRRRLAYGAAGPASAGRLQHSLP